MSVCLTEVRKAFSDRRFLYSVHISESSCDEDSDFDFFLSENSLTVLCINIGNELRSNIVCSSTEHAIQLIESLVEPFRLPSSGICAVSGDGLAIFKRETQSVLITREDCADIHLTKADLENMLALYVEEPAAPETSDRRNLVHAEF